MEFNPLFLPFLRHHIGVRVHTSVRVSKFPDDDDPDILQTKNSGHLNNFVSIATAE